MELPKGLTKKQFELLLLITPEPIGKGLKANDAAKQLGISRQAVTLRLNNFKKKFPNEYAILESMQTITQFHRIFLHDWFPQPRRIGYCDVGRVSFNKYEHSEYSVKGKKKYNYIKEKF